MTKPGGDPNATRPCRLCGTAVPRPDWPKPGYPIVCDTCARKHQTGGRLRMDVVKSYTAKTE